MTKNLLALSLALQKTTLDADQRLLLAQLGNNLEAVSKKKHPTEQDQHKIQTKINDILSRNATLAVHYQQFSTQLQTLNEKALQALLPSAEQLAPLKTGVLQTLGYIPASPPFKEEDIENTVVEIASIILKQDNPSDASKKLFPTNKIEKATEK